MRDIKFRGITGTTEGKKWAYGYLYKIKSFFSEDYQYFIKNEHLQETIIDEETVGQYTGLKDKNGKAVLLTKDHIYPKSKGGLNNIKNYQVLCEKCNAIKSDNSPVTLVQALRKGYATKKSVERAVKLHKPKALIGV